MSGFLIDTNIISEFVKSEPNQQVVVWFERVNPQLLFPSVITLGEIRMGIENLPFGKRRSEFKFWLERKVPDWFRSNLLPVSDSIAIVHELVLVTRNGKHFEGLGINIVNPWASVPNR